MTDKEERIFVLIKCYNGSSDTLGTIKATSPEKAAEKLNVEIWGFMTKQDRLNAYYIKKGSKQEPQYILENQYVLEKWKILDEFPKDEIEKYNLKNQKKQ